MALELKINEFLEILPKADYRTVENIQGDLKNLSKEDYDRLRTSLKENGLLMPFAMWLNPADEKMYLIDGNQRRRVFLFENVTPFEIPYILVPGKTIDESKKNLLQISSNYGKVTEKGLTDFVINLDIPQDWIDNTITFAALAKGFGDAIEKPVTHLPKQMEIKPFTKTHILISFPPERLIDLEEHIKKMMDYPDVEVEQGSN